MWCHARPAVVIVFMLLGILCGCGRPPADSSTNANAQKLPFDREPRSSGISPSRTLIPSTTKLPEGTPIPIRLQSSLSSAASHTGDSFTGTIEEPVVIDGQTLVAGGTVATGRVLEAKAATRRSLEPGYLRIVLESLSVDGRTVTIETSSIFAKGGAREEHSPAGVAAPGASPKERDRDRDKDRDKDITLGADRRLSFRLAQTVDLQ